MAGIGRTSGKGRAVDGQLAASAALAAARRYRALFPRGGYQGWEAAELQVLIALVVAPDRRVGELALELDLERTTVSNAATSLRDAKLIRDGADPEDGRAKLLAPTAKGRRLCQRYLAEVAALLE
jgi:DNA-binding MarR family transcriptional regulator